MGLRKWLAENYDVETLNEIVGYGVNSGFPGLSYYSDTVALYNEFDTDIWDIVTEFRDDYGYPLADSIKLDECYSHTQFANNMVWLAVQIVASEVVRELTDKKEDDEEAPKDE